MSDIKVYTDFAPYSADHLEKIIQNFLKENEAVYQSFLINWRREEAAKPNFLPKMWPEQNFVFVNEEIALHQIKSEIKIMSFEELDTIKDPRFLAVINITPSSLEKEGIAEKISKNPKNEFENPIVLAQSVEIRAKAFTDLGAEILHRFLVEFAHSRPYDTLDLIEQLRPILQDSHQNQDNVKPKPPETYLGFPTPKTLLLPDFFDFKEMVEVKSGKKLPTRLIAEWLGENKNTVRKKYTEYSKRKAAQKVINSVLNQNDPK